MENNQKKFDPSFEISQEESYDRAFKRVQKIKGFYVHFVVYVLVNIGLLVIKAKNVGQLDANFWTWQTLNTAFFWGIGLAIHGLSVFGKELFLGKDWEQKKLEQFMNEENEKQQKWK